ncbi:MAG TPA: hypothetical protein VHP36_02350 [Chitinispirillaceae bacterium]|nr:hypothetical protein [Chitinispirillaceae bacterium]
MSWIKGFKTTLGILLILICCCSPKIVTFEQKILSEADSLFREGNYEYAKVKYAKARELKPKSDVARTSQYYLAFINVYYDNPFANWEAALREFRTFAALYPDDQRIGEVNSWIRLLVVMQTFKKVYQGTNNKLEELSKKEPPPCPPPTPRKTNVDIITESLRNCLDAKDSLGRKTKEFESVILDLEKKCLQAGK